jgi:organic hydroperoxide reductase OsmC/OhrA
MGVVKAYRYPVRSEWHGGRLVRLDAPGKPPLQTATPPEFRGGVPGVWSPEDLLVGALTACYELTLVAVAERRGIPLHAVEVNAIGHLEGMQTGFEFTVFELEVGLVTDPERIDDATEAALRAKDHCVVARVLDVPVHIRVSAEARPGSVVAAAAP